MPRSVRVSANCIPRVKSALQRNAYISQRLLALELDISQSTVSNFLNGRPVDYSYFIEICRKLGLEWQDIADLEIPIEEEKTPVAPAASISPISTSQPTTVEFPEGRVEITSPFYIERPPRELRCFEEISKPGSLIRIKAPRQMGKTSLLARILHEAEKQGDHTVELSLQFASHKCFTNSDTFLKWFCASVAMALQLPNKLDSCWDLAEIVGSNMCCKAYFEEYLLPEIDKPLTLGLDEVDRVFEYPEIYRDFFGLLRALHEEAKRRDLWKKLRLVIVHSTEVYVPMDVNQSPFNVGFSVELPEFTIEQVQDLAQRYQLDWSVTEVRQLMAMVGGHPFLVRLALYNIARQHITLTQLLQTVFTDGGIYSEYLRRLELMLAEQPELGIAMREVVTSSSPVRLKTVPKFKLQGIGLVKLQG
ncbi:MAG: AAA-like domain-containing protein [Rhizonema sp. PD37]|nr:AAA-like domain-containing protein [Rhizonema sp. PD37]